MTVAQVAMRPTAARASRLIGFLLVLAAVTLWSTIPVGTRLLVRDGGVFSVPFLSAVRLWIAAGVFLAVQLAQTRRLHGLLPTNRRHAVWLFIAAMAIVANLLFYGAGLRFTTACATVVISPPTQALTVMLLAALLLGEPLTLRKLGGVCLALAGVLLVVFQGNSLRHLLTSSYFFGNVLEISASVAWPFYAIASTKLTHESHNQRPLTPIFVLAALLATAALPCTGPFLLQTPTPVEWAILLFLGLGSTAGAYWLFSAGLQRIETSEGSMLSLLIPLFAILLSHWLLREPMQQQVVHGLPLAIIGLLCIVWRSR